MTNDAPDNEWVDDACGIFDKHAQELGWRSHIYSKRIRKLLLDRDQAQAELQAAVAAEREACAKYHGNFLMTKTSCDVEKVVASTEAIRARTDTDAQAALEAVKREARNEALREAAAACENAKTRNTVYEKSRRDAADAILALMEDTDDE